MQKNKGITLIALVVTIIIMLILAGVALSMALGDNGLFQMAKFSRNKYEEAATNESTAMRETEEVFPKTARELTKDNYGDYVDYGLDLNEDGDFTNDWRIFYVGDATKNGKTEKCVFLIAADYVPNNCETLKIAEDSDHANMSASPNAGYNICCSYWKSGSSVEYHCNDKHNTSLNSDQPQCSFPEIFMPTGEFCTSEYHYYCSDYIGETGVEGNINSRCASSLQCTENWKSFVEQSTKGGCANYAIGGPTLEMWIASWNQKHGMDTEQEGKTGETLFANGKVADAEEKTGYYVGTTADCVSTSCVLSSTEGYNDTLYFPHKVNQNLDLFEDKKTGITEKDVNENANCWGYWLSSPSASSNNNLIYAGCSGRLNSNGYGSDYGVRPVVSLKSKVKLTKRDGTGEKVVYDIGI